MPVPIAGSNRKALTLISLFTLVLFYLLAIPLASPSANDFGVKYKLRADASAPGAFEVWLSFRLGKGDQVLLEPTDPRGSPEEGLATPVVEFRIQPGPGYQISPVEPGKGLTITADRDIGLEVPYRVSFEAGNPSQRAGEPSRNAKPSLPIISPDLQVFKASQVLICPRHTGTRAPIGNDYSIEFMTGSGHTVLTPWERFGQGYSFKVNGETGLLENYVSMGRIDTLERERGDCRITVGFTDEKLEFTPEQRKQYADDLTALFGRISETMGPRAELPRLSILVAGLRRYGLGNESANGLYGSVLTFSGTNKLRGEPAAISAGSIFELWNRWTIVPSDKGGGQWFQQGIPGFYSYRAAAEAGLLESGQAYSDFSRIYLAYISNPMASSTSLANAEPNADALTLVEEKGAVVCASLAERLAELTRGEKDIDWFLGELAEKFDHFQGTTYTMVDITELLEKATGKSWDRFFNARLNGTELLPPSEFSTSELFGAESNGVTGKKLVIHKSGQSWVILLAAVLLLFLIPLIFSTYVRRSVKLDLSMPRILPEEEDDQEVDGGS